MHLNKKLLVCVPIFLSVCIMRYYLYLYPVLLEWILQFFFPKNNIKKMDFPGTVRSTDPTARPLPKKKTDPTAQVHCHVTGPPQHQAAQPGQSPAPRRVHLRVTVSETPDPSDPKSTVHLASFPLEVSRSDLCSGLLPPPNLRTNSREKGSGAADARPGPGR